MREYAVAPIHTAARFAQSPVQHYRSSIDRGDEDAILAAVTSERFGGAGPDAGRGAGGSLLRGHVAGGRAGVCEWERKRRPRAPPWHRAGRRKAGRGHLIRRSRCETLHPTFFCRIVRLFPTTPPVAASATS